MKKLAIFVLFFAFFTVFAQNPEWINANGEDVRAIAFERDFFYVGTNGVLVRINKNTGEKKFYKKANSGLPDNIVNTIAIDNAGNKWIGTDGGGIAKFDGKNWKVFDTSNSGLPNNWVNTIAIDNAGNKWIGTLGGLGVYREGGVIIPAKKKK